MTYRDLMSTVARILASPALRVPVPLLSPRLSSQWLRLVTDVDLTTARALVDSMTNEVVVHDRSIDELVGPASTSFAAGSRASVGRPCARASNGRPARVRLADLLVGRDGRRARRPAADPGKTPGGGGHHDRRRRCVARRHAPGGGRLHRIHRARPPPRRHVDRRCAPSGPIPILPGGQRRLGRRSSAQPVSARWPPSAFSAVYPARSTPGSVRRARQRARPGRRLVAERSRSASLCST